MKNKLVWIVPVILLAAVTAGIFFWQSSKKISVEDLLPSDPIIVVRQDEAVKTLQQFLQSVFYKELRALNVPLLVEKTGADEKIIIAYKGLNKFLEDMTQDPLWQKFLGQEVVLAVYPVELSSLDFKAAGEIAQGIILVVKPEKDAQLAEFWGRMFFQGSKDYPTQISDYKGFKIVSVQVPALALLNLQVHYAAVKDYYVAGLSRTVIERSIDILRTPEKSLAKDQQFLKAKAKFLTPAQSFFFLDIEFFVAKIKEIMQQSSSSTSEIGGVFASLKGFKSIGYSADYAQPIRIKSDFYFNKEELVAGLKEIYSCTPKENKSARFIPKDILVYQWADCYDMNYYWSQFKKELETAMTEQNPSATTDPLEGMGNLLKMDVEKEILPVLGKEQGWGVADIDLGVDFPVPKVFLFIKVTDAVKAAQIMTKLTDEASLLVQTEDYKGMAIKYISTPIGPVVPGYLLVDDYLILSSSRDLLKLIVDTASGASPGVSADPIYSNAQFGLTALNNGVFFIRMSSAVEKLRGVVDWAVQWYGTKAREMKAYHAGSEKRLADLREEIKFLDIELGKLNVELKNLEKQKTDIAGQGGDILEVQSKISQVQADISLKEKTASMNQEKENELVIVVKEFEADKNINADVLPELVREGVYPVLRAFAAIEAVVAKIVFGDGVVESTGFIQIK